MNLRLPVVSGRELVRLLQKVGYEVVRQKGSHMRLRHPTDPRRKPTTVPDHKVLKRGTLKAVMRDAALTLEELLGLVRK